MVGGVGAQGGESGEHNLARSSEEIDLGCRFTFTHTFFFRNTRL